MAGACDAPEYGKRCGEGLTAAGGLRSGDFSGAARHRGCHWPTLVLRRARGPLQTPTLGPVQGRYPNASRKAAIMTEANSPGIVIFNSLVDPEASVRFKKWRQGNKILGHYLNANSEYGWVLHKAWCKHAGGNDLARNEKRCAARGEELRTYAAAQGINPHRCLTCRPK